MGAVCSARCVVGDVWCFVMWLEFCFLYGYYVDFVIVGEGFEFC